jgi:6-phosphofructokinase 1
MNLAQYDFTIDRLGPAPRATPMNAFQFIDDADRILYHGDLADVQAYFAQGQEPPSFEKAGPRRQIYFDPQQTVCGIVTCGGICPGINDVIRALVLNLNYHYGVTEILGFRYGYEGLNPAFGHEPLRLTPASVEGISTLGGTALGTSRGNQEIGVMVDELVRRKVNVLFTIGGDGTLRGAQALAEEIGTAREVLSRQLDAFAKAGLVRTARGEVTIVDRPALEARASVT